MIGRLGLAAYAAAMVGLAWFDGGASWAIRMAIALVFGFPLSWLAFKETQK